MIYKLILATPSFLVGYLYDSADPEMPVALKKIFADHQDWFRELTPEELAS